ncbi:MAG: NAD(P)H-hydrate dehydratase [Gammaproteobacteria bacterium]
MNSLLPRNLYTSSQVRELDRQAIEEQGLEGLSLMEAAGQAAFNLLNELWPDAWRIVIVCGTGNNGGDGYVISRLAQQGDKNVALLQVGDHENLQGDAKACAEKSAEAGIKHEAFSVEKLEQADVIIDAIFGTGLDRNIEGEYFDVINAINNSSAPILAIDIPTGLNADTGSVMGAAIEAQATISFIGAKQGLLTGEGATYSGDVYFDDLKVPDEVYESVPVSCSRVDLLTQKSTLDSRKATGHKGQYGHTLIVGGDHGFAGAVRMAAEAAARSGSGLVSLATRERHATQIAMSRPELMAHSVERSNTLLSLINRATVVAIGPGLGQDKWGQEMLGAVLESTLPLIVDADALNLIAQDPVYRENWVLTPHPGEAARMLDCSIAEIQQDRFAAVTELQQKYGGVIVLKGSGTLITSEKTDISLCTQGNPGMATGGMGDVLTGVIAGLVAQGLDLFTASQTGVCVHANAADLAAKNGQRGMLALDLMPEIRASVNF